MDITMSRWWLVISIALIIHDFPPINSQDGFTEIIKFSLPWKRNYFLYVAPANSRNLARDICKQSKFSLAKVEFQHWFNGLSNAVNHRYWLDIDLQLTDTFHFKNGTVFPEAVTSLAIPRPHCAFVRKKAAMLEVFADSCDKEKFSILVQPCTGSSACPPQRSSIRMSWYEARNFERSQEPGKTLYEGVPHELINALDENETNGYWIDVSRAWWIYKYIGKSEDVMQTFWDTGKPTVSGDDEGCVIGKENGRWENVFCTRQSNVRVVCYNESRATTITPPKTTTPTTTTSTSTTTTTTATTITTTQTTAPTSTSTTSSTTTTTTTTAPPSTTTTAQNNQSGVGRSKSGSQELSDIQVGFIAGSIGLISFLLILAAILTVLIIKCRRSRAAAEAASMSQSTFTMAAKSLSYGNNNTYSAPPSQPSHFESNFNIYTTQRYHPRGGLSSKLYKSDEAYLKNSVLRNSKPASHTFRSSMALPPPRKW